MLKKIPIPKVIKRFSQVFITHGFQLFIVGGAVRDCLLGRPVQDYDFCTDASPDQMQKIFPYVIPTGIDHGTVTILFEDDKYEVTTFRIDGVYKDSRHPDNVTFSSSIEEDLKRRDFTVNALAVDTRSGKLLDYHQGCSDLKKRIIRAIGEPELRFSEDALRILRACRFSSTLEFEIEKNTFAAMKNLSSSISNVSVERITAEFRKIILSDTPSLGISSMLASNILQYILPELVACIHIEQKGFHIYDVYHHLLATCNAIPKEYPLIRIAGLLHDIGKPQVMATDPNGKITFYKHEVISAEIAYSILIRLKFPNKERDYIVHLIRYHMFHYTTDWTDAAVRRFLHTIGPENFHDFCILRLGDTQGITGKIIHGPTHEIEELTSRVNAINLQETALKLKDLKINGKDLQNIGIAKGPKIGIILNELLDTVLDDPSNNTYDILISIAKNLANRIN